MNLIILDADGTLAPHITVGFANKIFLSLFFKTFFSTSYKFNHILRTKETIWICIKSFFKNKIKFDSEYFFKLFIIVYYGAILYSVKYVSDILYFLHFKKVDNKYLLKKFEKIIQKIEIDYKNYYITKSELKNSIYPGLKEVLGKLKGKKIIISQSFSPMLDMYKSLLGVDVVYGNKFKKDFSFKLNVTGSASKLSIAKKLIAKYKPKKVYMFLNDYHDVELASLGDVVVAKGGPRRLRRLATYVVKDYRKLIIV